MYRFACYHLAIETYKWAVADIDDYFDYEKPLDFVSRAEKRKLLKEAQGDEELANQMLIERTNAAAESTTESTSQMEEKVQEAEVVDVDAEPVNGDDDSDSDSDASEETPAEEAAMEEEQGEQGTEEVDESTPEEPRAEKADKVEDPPKKAFKKPEEKPKQETSFDTDDFDILGLD